MKYCVCKQCGEKVKFDAEVLWGHLELDHKDRFYDMQIYNESDMMNECFKVVEDNRLSYKYTGPVTRFGTIISNEWNATTSAESEQKALSNLMYRFKATHNIEQWVKIEMPGIITIID